MECEAPSSLHFQNFDQYTYIFFISYDKGLVLHEKYCILIKNWKNPRGLRDPMTF